MRTVGFKTTQKDLKFRSRCHDSMKFKTKTDVLSIYLTYLVKAAPDSLRTQIMQKDARVIILIICSGRKC